MATEVTWTEPALDELNEIYAYYREHKSEATAVKLFNTIVDASDRLALFPEMGKIEEQLRNRQRCYRSIIERNYKIVYYIEKSNVYIAMVWDCRQSPLRLLDRLK